MARPLLCCALLAPLLATALQVWDNVLVRSRTAALERSVEELGGSHFLLDRQAVKPRCLLRNSLDELLHSVGDSSRYVEFWTREDWINLDVHRDVDEFLHRRSGEMRTPNHAHVLYVDIGSHCQGPTALFLENEAASINRVVSVPAVSMRLLRFQGHIIHAVPRPALAMLDPDLGGSNHEIFSRIRDDAKLNTTFKRRVILFNTWEEPPEEVVMLPVAEGPEVESAVADKALWTTINVEVVPEEQDWVRMKLLQVGVGSRRVRPRLSSIELQVNPFAITALQSSGQVFQVCAREKQA